MEEKKKDLEGMRWCDLESTMEVVGATGCVISYRPVNLTAPIVLDDNGFPKTMAIHAKSADSDGLIPFDVGLCKLSKKYYEARKKYDANKSEENEKEVQRLLKFINRERENNKKRQDDDEKEFKGVEGENEERSKFKVIKELKRKLDECSNFKEKESIKKLLALEIEYLNTLAFQTVVPDIKKIDNEDYEIFYLKQKEPIGDLDIGVKLDDSGKPVVYAKKGDNFFRIKGYTEEGKPEIEVKELQKNIIEEENPGYSLEQRRVFATIQCSDVKARVEEIANGQNGELSYSEFETKFEKRLDTADDDQLLIATTEKTIDFALADEGKSFFTDDDKKLLDSFKRIQSKSKEIIPEDIYNTTYFMFDGTLGQRINSRVEKLKKEIKTIGEEIHATRERDGILDINKHIKLLEKIIQVSKLQSLGVPHLTTELLAKKTKGVVNHGPEIYHFYPEDINEGDKFITIVPNNMVNGTEAIEKIQEIQGIEDAEYLSGRVIVLEGLDGIANFTNYCRQNGIAFPEVNPLWPISLDLSSSPTSIKKDKPILTNDEYAVLCECGEKAKECFIKARRLELQPDIVLKDTCEQSGFDTGEVRRYTMTRNMNEAYQNYANCLSFVKEQVKEEHGKFGASLQSIIVQQMEKLKDACSKYEIQLESSVIDRDRFFISHQTHPLAVVEQIKGMDREPTINKISEYIKSIDNASFIKNCIISLAHAEGIPQDKKDDILIGGLVGVTEHANINLRREIKEFINSEENKDIKDYIVNRFSDLARDLNCPHRILMKVATNDFGKNIEKQIVRYG
jgi:hypothetical protein